MWSIAHHPKQESGINLEIHSPRLCGGEKQQNMMMDGHREREKEAIWEDEETRGQ